MESNQTELHSIIQTLAQQKHVNKNLWSNISKTTTNKHVKHNELHEKVNYKGKTIIDKNHEKVLGVEAVRTNNRALH